MTSPTSSAVNTARSSRRTIASKQCAIRGRSNSDLKSDAGSAVQIFSPQEVRTADPASFLFAQLQRFDIGNGVGQALRDARHAALGIEVIRARHELIVRSQKTFLVRRTSGLIEERLVHIRWPA